MRIKELADQADVSPRAVRHYEAAGLIVSAREANGYRDFPDKTVVRVRNIKALLDVSLTLDDIRAFECCLDGDVAAARPAQSKLDLAAARLQVLQRRRDNLVAACSRLEQALATAQSAIES